MAIGRDKGSNTSTQRPEPQTQSDKDHGDVRRQNVAAVKNTAQAAAGLVGQTLLNQISQTDAAVDQMVEAAAAHVAHILNPDEVVSRMWFAAGKKLSGSDCTDVSGSLTDYSLGLPSVVSRQAFTLEQLNGSLNSPQETQSLKSLPQSNQKPAKAA